MKKAIVTICLLIAACYIINNCNRYVPEEYIVISQQIRADVATTLTKRYPMRIIGITGGLANSVNILGLSFQIKGPLSKERLREIIVDCVEEFLTPINANERLRPFLKNYPFTANEIEIEIYIVDETGRRLYDPEIMFAGESNGTLRYRTVDINDKLGFKSYFEEDYETAHKLVQGLK